MGKNEKLKITCMVIEDQMPARQILKKYINEVEVLDLKAMFSNAIEALDYIENNSVDLLFLDIHLPKLSGIEFLEVLKTRPKVVLTTAFPDYSLLGYELDIVDYLLKPFSFQRFLKAVIKVQRQINVLSIPKESKTPDSILVKEGYDLVTIKIEQIKYIQADGDYTIIFCETKKHHVSYPLKYWLENLPARWFIRAHRSFVVNIREVQRVSSNSIKVIDSKIPLGRVFRKDFLLAYKAIEK